MQTSKSFVPRAASDAISVFFNSTYYFSSYIVFFLPIKCWLLFHFDSVCEKCEKPFWFFSLYIFFNIFFFIYDFLSPFYFLSMYIAHRVHVYLFYNFSIYFLFSYYVWYLLVHTLFYFIFFKVVISAFVWFPFAEWDKDWKNSKTRMGGMVVVVVIIEGAGHGLIGWDFVNR